MDRTVLKVFCFKTLAVTPILIGQCKTCSCFKTLAVTPILIGQCKTCSVSMKTLTVTQILTGQYEGCSCFKTLAVTSADFHRAMRNAFLFQNASSQLCLGLDLIICQPELLKVHTLFFFPLQFSSVWNVQTVVAVVFKSAICGRQIRAVESMSENGSLN